MSHTSAGQGPAFQSPLPGARYSPAHRPTWFDFFFLLIGVSASLVLAGWSGFVPRDDTEGMPPLVKQHLLDVLPQLLFLPVGPLLLWPLFYLTQLVRGRKESMSSGEWLWGVAWLAVLPWAGWVGWQRWGTPVEVLQPETMKRWVFLGYAVGVLALGSLAAILTLIGLVGRWRPPWTHSLCLALLMWPALWLACCKAWGIEIK